MLTIFVGITVYCISIQRHAVFQKCQNFPAVPYQSYWSDPVFVVLCHILWMRRAVGPSQVSPWNALEA